MIVTLNLYATFRQIVGVKSLLLDLPLPSRVLDSLEALCLQHPAMRAQLFDAEGNLYGYTHLFINKRDISFLPDGLEHELHAQDTLDIFPPVGGG